MLVQKGGEVPQTFPVTILLQRKQAEWDFFIREIYT